MYVYTVVLALFGLCVAQDMYIQEWAPETYPNPQISANDCGRRGHRGSWICDPDRILSRDEANQLDRLIGEIRNTTTCPCAARECKRNNRGYHIAVALAKKIVRGNTYKVENEETVAVDMNDVSERIQERLHKIEMFSVVTKNNWKYGRCGEDVIIVYSMYDNVVYAMAGKKASKTLKPGLIGEIIESARMNFGASAKRDKFQGLKQIITSFRSVFDGHYKTQYRHHGVHPTPAALMGSDANNAHSYTPIYATVLTAVALVFAHFVF